MTKKLQNLCRLSHICNNMKELDKLIVEGSLSPVLSKAYLDVCCNNGKGCYTKIEMVRNAIRGNKK